MVIVGAVSIKMNRTNAVAQPLDVHIQAYKNQGVVHDHGFQCFKKPMT